MQRSQAECAVLTFDWDGTLCDSDYPLDRALEDVLPRQPGGDAILRILQPQLFRPRTSPLGRLVVSLCADRTEVLREIAAKEAQLKAHAALFNGIKEMLSILRSKGFRLAVVTGKLRKDFDFALQKAALDQEFAASVCGDEAAPKPAPEPMYRVASALGRVPTLYIGNSSIDASFAQACECDFIPVHFDRRAARPAGFGEACSNTSELLVRILSTYKPPASP